MEHDGVRAGRLQLAAAELVALQAVKEARPLALDLVVIQRRVALAAEPVQVLVVVGVGAGGDLCEEQLRQLVESGGGGVSEERLAQHQEHGVEAVVRCGQAQVLQRQRDGHLLLGLQLRKRLPGEHVDRRPLRDERARVLQQGGLAGRGHGNLQDVCSRSSSSANRPHEGPRTAEAGGRRGIEVAQMQRGQQLACAVRSIRSRAVAVDLFLVGVLGEQRVVGCQDLLERFGGAVIEIVRVDGFCSSGGVF